MPSPAAADAMPPDAAGRALTAVTRAGAHASQLRALRQAAARRSLTFRIFRADARTRYWRRLMHLPVPPPPRLARLTLAELERAADWRAERAEALERAGRHPPHLADWRCIQQHETAAPFPGWHTDSGNGYFGGLQFDRSFQATYGLWLYRSKGTAENWTPLEQIWTAEFARRHARGFTPWPRTARQCGLL